MKYILTAKAEDQGFHLKRCHFTQGRGKKTIVKSVVLVGVRTLVVFMRLFRVIG